MPSRKIHDSDIALKEYAALRLSRGWTPGEVYAEMTERFGWLTPESVQTILNTAAEWVEEGKAYSEDVENLTENPTTADNPLLVGYSEANVLVTFTMADGTVQYRTLKPDLSGSPTLSALMDEVDTWLNGVMDKYQERFSLSSWSIVYVR
jgi:hypothetical protein